MAHNAKQCERLAAEKQLLKQRMPGFEFRNPRGNTYIEGYAQATNGLRCLLRIDLPEDYPYSPPPLYVAAPRRLYSYEGRQSVNEMGSVHSFHTMGNGPNGIVSICHFREWNAAHTCLQILIKGILWWEAYMAHMRTGRDLAEFLRDPTIERTRHHMSEPLPVERSSEESELLPVEQPSEEIVPFGMDTPVEITFRPNTRRARRISRRNDEPRPDTSGSGRF